MKVEEARARSNEKMKQINNLMSVLHVQAVGRQMINKEGFIDIVIVYQDNEKYDIEKEPSIDIEKTGVESPIEQSEPVNLQESEVTGTEE